MVETYGLASDANFGKCAPSPPLPEQNRRVLGHLLVAPASIGSKTDPKVASQLRLYISLQTLHTASFFMPPNPWNQ